VKVSPDAPSPRPGFVMMRRALAVIAALAVVVALAYSAWHDVPDSWQILRSEHAAYAKFTRDQRDREFGARIPMPMEIFDYWRSGLRPHDRYWIQMPPEPFSSNGDKRYVARSIAHIYLLPAIEAQKLSDANVVLSWDADPGLLHLHFVEQQRQGLQLIFVSRIA
jgi:hypothetical protein